MSLLVLIAASCAQQRSLSGGEKDVTPPNALASDPPHLTTNFVSDRIVILFDEYVQLNNIQQELVISPPLQKAPRIRLRKKGVIISWDEELLPNTTYTFNFGDGIMDINEGNKAQDLVYVFSTGSVIDSLQITGTVTDALKDIPAEGLKVIAFESDTAVFSKKPRPLYFTRTKADGSFRLDHMRDNAYYIYVLDDLNSNYRYDESEAFAFADSVIHPQHTDSTARRFLVSVPRLSKPVINDYITDSTGYMAFAWDTFYPLPDVVPLGGVSASVSHNRQPDTVEVRLSGVPTERYEQFRIQWQNAFSDTIEIGFFSEAQRNPFALRTNITDRVKKEDSLYVFSLPTMSLVDSSKIILTEDSVAVPMSFVPDQTLYRMQAELRDGKKYLLQIMPGAFTNAAGGMNDTLTMNFSTYRPEDLGTIILELDPGMISSNVFSLSDKTGVIKFTHRNVTPGTLVIPRLPAGSYTATFLDDRNGNGLYDAGEIGSHRQPERTYTLVPEINVRANWEIKLTWEPTP